MARRIIEDGFPTTLWARRPESLEPYDGTGAAYAADRRALGAASDVLCVCVIGDADVDDVLRGDDGALAEMAPGGIVVIHSTVHPDTCRRLQTDFSHLHFVDAPVSGGGHMAAAKALLVMVGGDDDVVEPVPAGARHIREPSCPPRGIGCRAGGEAAEQCAVQRAPRTGRENLLRCRANSASTRMPSPRCCRQRSGRSYAAEVIAGSGHSLSVIAELAGPLLTKDVDILAD